MVDSFTGPMRSNAPSGSPTRYTDPKEIDQLLKTSDPGAVTESGQSYQKFAAAYEKIAAQLLAMRSDLHDAWSGKDAAAAQSQLREVWSAATSVHRTARTFGVVVERHGSESLAWYKNNKPPSKSLAEAQSWMTGANERVSQSWSSLPQDISTTLPPGHDRLGRGPASDSSGGTYGGSVGGTSAGSTGGGGLSDSGGHFPGSGHLPSHDGGGGANSQLAGLNPPGGTTEGGAGFGPPPGSVGGPGLGIGGSPSLPSGGGYSFGSGLLAPSGVSDVVQGGAGTPGVPGGRSFGAPSEAAAGEVQAGTASRAGTTGPLMGAGGSEREERERTRQTWLAEDEDVWTGGIEVAPHLIRAEVPEGENQESAEAFEIDLTADEESIAGLLDELGPDIGAEPDRAVAVDTSTQIAELRAQLARLEQQRDAEQGTAGDEDLDLDWL